MKGTYLLEFRLESSLSFTLRSGRRVSLTSGVYFYAGSAFGPGGLYSRLSRHLKRRKKRHWHLDFITTAETFTPLSALLIPELPVECTLASIVSELSTPVPNFGSSDCTCPSHLFLAQNPQKVKEAVLKAFPGAKILKTEELKELKNGV